LNFPVYIARRYFVAKKSHNIINIISGISVAGVTIGTLALIIVLSVFNGFEKLVVSLFNSFNPDILITVTEGKTFDTGLVPEDRIRKIPGVRYLCETIEENALLKYRDKQNIVTIKGVGDDYMPMTRLDTMMVNGTFILRNGTKEMAVLGYGVAYNVGASLQDYQNPLTVYVPRRTASFAGGFENAFNSEVIFPSGFFSVQQDFDTKYVILPISFAKKLLDYSTQVTGIEIGLAPGSDHEKIQQQMKDLLGETFSVKNRFQQEATLYKIMKSEKWAIFLILSFILLIATFNVVGSLSMLIIDKKPDIATLRSLGANQKMIRRIFLSEGLMISLIGAIAGLIIGGVTCWLQQVYGFVKLGAADSTFVVNSYPVNMQATDFIFVFVTVMCIGFLAAWFPAYNIKSNEQ
jgi:lipoprotein-releasing system permease protein